MDISLEIPIPRSHSLLVRFGLNTRTTTTSRESREPERNRLFLETDAEMKRKERGGRGTFFLCKTEELARTSSPPLTLCAEVNWERA